MWSNTEFIQINRLKLSHACSGPYSYYQLIFPFKIEGKTSTSLLSPFKRGDAWYELESEFIYRVMTWFSLVNSYDACVLFRIVFPFKNVKISFGWFCWTKRLISLSCFCEIGTYIIKCLFYQIYESIIYSTS